MEQSGGRWLLESENVWYHATEQSPWRLPASSGASHILTTGGALCVQGIIRSLFLLTSAPLLGLADAAYAHIGDEVYFFYELLDEDLDRIDLTDGSVEDWLEVVGEPSLKASDFFWLFGSYDLSELDFRIWLAWHQGSGTLWVAMERFDDLYFNRYDGAGLHEMVSWDSSIAFMVDGDHTGGIYGQLLGINCGGCTAEQVLWNHRQAQRWMAIAEAPGGGDTLDYDGASEWVIREPYAAAGGGVIGESPATTITEFMVTPFDDLIYNDEDASEASQLFPGKIIGFSISMWDNDDIQYEDGSGRGIIVSLSRGWRVMVNADLFVDGLLLGAGEDPSRYDDVSAVEPSSWGRIKASFE